MAAEGAQRQGECRPAAGPAPLSQGEDPESDQAGVGDKHPEAEHAAQGAHGRGPAVIAAYQDQHQLAGDGQAHAGHAQGAQDPGRPSVLRDETAREVTNPMSGSAASAPPN